MENTTIETIKNVNLKEHTKKLLVLQGFSTQDIDYYPNILPLTKWTPLLCGLFGLLGILLKSPYYLFTLGALTSIGAFSSHSLYDYVYKYFFRYIIKFGDPLPHGIQRRIGCGIGAVFFILSSFGFYFDIILLAYIPSCFMVVFAFIAGIFDWCFVSIFYSLFNKGVK